MGSAKRRTSGRGRWVWALVGLGAVLLCVGYFTIPLGTFGPDHPALSWTGFGVALALVALLLLRQVLRVAVPSDGGHPAAGILLAVCLSLVVFATSYLALSGQEGQFNGLDTRVDALYFTLVTASTVGYGDITATGQTARVVVMVQMVYNVLFLTAAATAFSQQLRGRAAARTRRATGAEPPGDGTADQV